MLYGIHSEESEGLKVIGGTGIACNQMLRAVDDIGIQVSSVMWDFNDYGMLIYGCGVVHVVGSYISGRTANPTIWVKSSSGVGIGQNSRKINIANNSVVQNLSTPASICIKIESANNVNIHDNDIHGYVSNGIEYTGSTVTFISIKNNTFDADAGVTGEDIRYISSECSTAIIQGNILDAGMTPDVSVTRRISGNIGYTSEANGTAIILSATTSISVTHGLDFTPVASEISLTPQESGTNDWGTLWVSAVGATTFTINCKSDPGASNLDVGWNVKIIH